MNWRYFLQLERKDVTIAIVLGVTTGLLAVSLFGLSGYLIAKAALAPPMLTLILLIALLKLGSFAKAFSRYGERLFSHRATFSLLAHIRQSFYRQLEPIGAQLLHRYRGSDLLARLIGDVESLQHYFLRVIYPPIVMIAVFLVTASVVTTVSPAVALVLLIGLLVTGFVMPRVFSRQSFDDVRAVRARAVVTTNDWYNGREQFLLHGEWDERFRETVATLATYDEWQQKKLGAAQRNVVINQWLANLFVALSLFVAIALAVNGLYLAMLVMIAVTVFEWSVPVAASAPFAQEEKAATERLTLPQLPTARDGVELLTTAPTIAFHDVQFRYDACSIAHRLTFELPRGQKTAIVGASGSGKSTALHLLLRLYERDGGTITLNGTALERYDVAHLYDATATALQEPHFFAGTVRDNLALAAEANDDEMTAALAAVELEHITLTSPIDERATNLSGGERQRLELARLLLRESKLVLLDEATSALDRPLERRLLERLFSAKAGATVVAVTHRLDITALFDHIIVIDEGEVVEQGTFATLQASNGPFAALYHLDAQQYES